MDSIQRSRSHREPWRCILNQGHVQWAASGRWPLWESRSHRVPGRTKAEGGQFSAELRDSGAGDIFKRRAIKKSRPAPLLPQQGNGVSRESGLGEALLRKWCPIFTLVVPRHRKRIGKHHQSAGSRRGACATPAWAKGVVKREASQP